MDGRRVWWCSLWQTRYTRDMRVLAGTVRNGVIIPESPEGLVEGTTVSVVANDGETSFTAPPDDEAELLAALAEEAGTISAEDLLSRLG